MENLSKDQQEAYGLMTQGHNLVLLGAAGTGKSFVLKRFVSEQRKCGKAVTLTCTTGIACCVYSGLGAMTIHKWAGIEDGRYEPCEIVDVITNNVKYRDVVQRIKVTDILLIDEVSMLSKRNLESIAEVCTIRNAKLLFGGMQVILCGDFRQLPPVPNTLLYDQGEYCFASDIFKVFPHTIILNEVKRQDEGQLVKCVEDVTCGTLSNETIAFLKSLNRPLKDNTSTKLFATNSLVDDFNRKSILDWPGDLYEYPSSDSGNQQLLQKIIAPKTLWLKKGCPVILLRNLSDILVNGLRGVVDTINENGIAVEFPSLAKIVPIQKSSFSVFSISEMRDVAVREQFPLKLAFALSIHKAQGMTLDSVEVDCRGIFKAGQLGVAIGRAKSSSGLRVINFSPKVVMVQPEEVRLFLDKVSNAIPFLKDDMSCCIQTARSPDKRDISTVQEILAVNADVDFDVEVTLDDSEFDEQFDELIRNIDENNEAQNVDLPGDFDLKCVIESLKTTEVVTPMQLKTNEILSRINRVKLLKFCKISFFEIQRLLNQLNIAEPVPVKAKDLGEFFRKFHAYSISAEYRMSCLELFDSEESFSNEHVHICFNVAVAKRKHLLKGKVSLFPVIRRTIVNRKVTDASKARIRYVGGYCIAKVRFTYTRTQNSNRYAQTCNGQEQYQEATKALNVLNNLREEEQFLNKHTQEPDSLIDVNRRQYQNRSLTNISDNLFHFFVDLTSKCLSLLVDENMNKHGQGMFNECLKDILSSDAVFRKFRDIANTSIADMEYLQPTDQDVGVDESLIRKIYEKIVKKFLLVMFSQYRKDVLRAFSVEKTMSHRKQIQARKGKKTSKPKESEEPRPSTSYAVTCKRKPACPPKKSDRKGKKHVTVIQLSSSSEGEIDIIPSTDTVTHREQEESEGPHPSTSYSGKGKRKAPPSRKSNRKSKKRVQSSSEEELDVLLPTETSQTQGEQEGIRGESDEDDEGTVCSVCDTEDKDVDWIRCDSCSNWFHRLCTGLKNPMKWKKMTKRGATFYCNDCK